jgi:putrescine aminotransferase
MDEERGLLDVDQAVQLDRDEIKENYKKYVNPGLMRMFSLLNFDKKYEKAEGTRLWDSEGNQYLDFLGGYGALNLGHNPDKVLKAIKQVEHLPNILQASMGTMTSAAAKNLAKITPGKLSHTFFANSGTEAVEGAIKLARAASGKEKIIYAEGSFHGKTMGSLSITGRTKYQKPFSPLMPASEEVPYGDPDALELKLKYGNIAAFIVEPIQGEAGIIIPPEGYLKEIRALCDKYDTYLIFDEIQTGLGRTGELFACEAEDIVPDIMCLAKSLGGGVMPVGAFTTTEDIWGKAFGGINKALLHTSTFGGNTLATAAVIAATNQIVEDRLTEQAQEKGEYLLAKLQKLADRHEMIAEVRGRGLMVGLEFKQPKDGILDKISQGMFSKLSHEYMGAMVAGTLLNDYQIITAYTLNNPNVIRLEPPLIVTYDQLDSLVGALAEIFDRYDSVFGVAMKSAKSVISGVFK